MSKKDNPNLFPIEFANVRQERLFGKTDYTKLAFMGFLPSNPPRAIKNVEVDCLRKSYWGVGIRNTKGGMEFFNLDYNNKHNMLLEDKLETLRKQKNDYTKEYDNLLSELTEKNALLSKWKKDISTLRARSKFVTDKLNTIIFSPDFTKSSSKKALSRTNLRREQKDITSVLRNLDSKISSLYQKKRRLHILEGYLSQIDAKIDDLCHNLKTLGTVTIGRPEALYFPHRRNIKSRCCCLFLDLFDFMSYTTLLEYPEGTYLPLGCDCYVMNDPRNFIAMTLSSDEYDKVYLFFPQTFYGLTLEQTISQRNPGRTVNASRFYNGHVSLYDYVRSLKSVKQTLLIK